MNEVIDFTTTSFDTTALAVNPSTEQIQAYRRSHTVSGRPVYATSAYVAMVTIDVIIIALLINFLDSRQDFSQGLSLGVLAIVAAAMVLFGVTVWRQGRLNQIRGAVIFEQLARSSNLSYTYQVKEPKNTGFIFTRGRSRSIGDQFISRSTPSFEIGNYQYTTTHSNRSVTVHSTGYITRKLSDDMPRMLLVATKRVGTGEYGIEPLVRAEICKKEQLVSLGGVGEGTFTLYGEAHQQGVLQQLVSLDSLRQLASLLSGCDIEVVGGQLYVYGVNFNFRDTQTWMQIDAALQVLPTLLSSGTQR